MLPKESASQKVPSGLDTNVSLDLSVVLPLLLAYCTSVRGRGREKAFQSCCCEKQAWILPAAAETNSKRGPSQAPASRVCYPPFS